MKQSLLKGIGETKLFDQVSELFSDTDRSDGSDGPYEETYDMFEGKCGNDMRYVATNIASYRSANEGRFPPECDGLIVSEDDITAIVSARARAMLRVVAKGQNPLESQPDNMFQHYQVHELSISNVDACITDIGMWSRGWKLLFIVFL